MIPQPPPLSPLPPPRPRNCKIVIASGKVEEGYCIVGNDLIPQGDNNFLLPGTKIMIDRLSASLFRYPNIRAFVAVKDPKSGVYALQPLRESDLQKYNQGRLSSKDLERKYEAPQEAEGGTFGEIVVHPTQGVVVKKSKSGLDGDFSQDMVKEISAYRLLSEIACLPKMYDFRPGKTVEIALEKGQVLTEVIKQKLDLDSQRMIMFRSAKCLRAIASQGCIHCDLKPPNMVVGSDGKVLIIDWGTMEIDQSRGQQKVKSTEIQTMWWRAPEIFEPNPMKRYSCAIDIFSLGLIFLDIFKGKQGFIGEEDENWHKRSLMKTLLGVKPRDVDNTFFNLVGGESLAGRIRENLMIDPISMPEDMADLVSKMLEFNPVHRIDYDGIVIHPFFQYMSREGIPKMPVFINNMPEIPSIDKLWTVGELKPRMRLITMDWIIDLCLKFKVSYDTFCLSWQLLDLYLYTGKEILRKNLQGYSAIAFLIASKLHENFHPEITDLVYFSDNLYKASQMVEFETEIMTALNGNVAIPSLYSYYSHYIGEIRIGKGGERLWEKARGGHSPFTKRLFDSYLRDDIYKVPFSKTWRVLLG